MSSGHPLRVSVISTVLNEQESVPRLMGSLLAQTRQPDEIIIVDGGSQDGTVAEIERYASCLPLRVLIVPGANISQGRNRAIAEATGDVIAVTDAGVRLHPRWLEALIAPLEVSSELQVVSGFFFPDPQSLLEVAMGATVLPALEDIRPDRFLPSSRSIAFRREAWQAVGGYPEWLDYCEDLVFDLRLRDRFGSFGWAPDAVAYFRPRTSLRAFFTQYYRYARGDGKADLWRWRHLVRYTTYLILAPALIGLGIMHSPGWWGVLVLGGAIYCRRPWQRLTHYWSDLSFWHKLWALALVPIIRLVGDVAKMIGYPIGWVWRWRHRHRPELRWRAKGQ
ncbi:MAG: glycosyltransferase [Anaerolineae bacterium]|nr:glycosyltransferase [Anaerolineae bacterium]MDW8099166.1 glycosyltransferase [Anaerolineae bacterium]